MSKYRISTRRRIAAPALEDFAYDPELVEEEPFPTEDEFEDEFIARRSMRRRAGEETVEDIEEEIEELEEELEAVEEKLEEAKSALRRARARRARRRY